MVVVVVQLGVAGNSRKGWGTAKTLVLFIGSLRRFEGKISLRRWGSPVEAVLGCRPDSRPLAR
jgi:hypothetical protein